MPESRKKKGKGKKASPVKSLPKLPDGYVEGTTSDGKTYIVPQYLLADLEAHSSTKERNIRVQLLRTSTGSGIPLRKENNARITEFEIKCPPDPPLSQHDILEQHAKVLALCDNLGISYKDACHRLYLAEIEHLRAERDALYAFEQMEEKVKDSLAQLCQEIESEVND